MQSSSLSSRARRRSVLGLAIGALGFGHVRPAAGATIMKDSAAHQHDLDRVWTPSHPSQRVWAYIDRHSVFDGERFDIMAARRPDSAPLKAEFRILRIGAYHDTENRHLVWASAPGDVPAIWVPGGAASTGVNWPVYIADVDTTGWEPGCSTVDAVAADSWTDENVASIVVKGRVRAGDVLVKISVNTTQAYNAWGGHSLTQTRSAVRRAP